MKDTVSEGMMTIVVIVVIGLLLVGAKALWPYIQEKIIGTIDEKIAYVEIVDEARL